MRPVLVSLDEAVYCEVMFDKGISGEVPEHRDFIYETAIPALERMGVNLPAALQPQQPFLLVLRNADVLDRSGRQVFLIALDGPDLAVTLDGALPAQREGAHHALFRAAGDPPGEQVYIGLGRTFHRTGRMAALRESQCH